MRKIYSPASNNYNLPIFSCFMHYQEILEKNILDFAKLNSAPPETKKIFLQTAVKEIMLRVVERIKTELGPEKSKDFMEIFSQDKYTDIQREEFLKTTVPNFEEILLTETLKFKQQFFTPPKYSNNDN